MKKILYVGSEAAPFIKTGGLGAVIGSLPKELRKKGHDVRIVLPSYECIENKWKKQMIRLVSFPVTLGWRVQRASVLTLEYQGVPCYFIENPFYFAGEQPYADVWLDLEKFSFFDKAVLEMIAYLDFVPDIIHCHDWQTGLIPVYLKNDYGRDPFYQRIKTVMTIHNLRFQGISEIGHMKDVTGLPDHLFAYDKLGHYGSASMLKGGLSFADKITTVSKTYAGEIQQGEYGEGLDGLLRYRSQDLSGIINGIDYQEYSPATDPHIKYHYNTRTFGKAKKKNKKCLQTRTGLPEDKNTFAICMITRLTDQKGLDLLEYVMDGIMQENVQLYVLGSGEQRYEEMFSYYKERYPDKIYVNFHYEDGLAKMMYAGCDATLMPSRFEPCGLSQLMALRYGTVPIVRMTGGLKDTVTPYREEYQTGTGFGFEAYESGALRTAIDQAIRLYESDPTAWEKMVRRGMQKNYSWSASAAKYEELYEKLG